ncbi:NUDIX hydrolase N-terminal domain-containing protein [Virgibacillus sp. C22-A2]|uniref:NUDIX hydrolase N-terminal domain-containing protein n=1 Tax=Virgibacillus tibetensis TaxID=3042313 RepID=A0ABU6KEB1_9BACI|nr:NUDIX hydrolase N-terminal domain-containing protein [Virgibacillus sp. C22-A2]
METAEQIKLWARDLRSIAQTGLAYGSDVFDRERYHQINETAIQMLSHISGINAEEVTELLPIETGYTTPKVAVRGVVIKNSKILMVKEAADGLWCLPGGWCDVGLSPSENIEKEIIEETGLRTKTTKLLSFFDQTKTRPSVTMQYIYTIYFKCEIISGELKNSIETNDVAFFAYNELPPLSKERITPDQIKTAIQIAEQANGKVYFH